MFIALLFLLSRSHPKTCVLYLSYAVEEYLYVVNAPGQQLTEAQTRTPLLGPTGPACTLSFDFALTGNLSHIGEPINVSFGYLRFQKTEPSDVFVFLFFFYAGAAGELSVRVIDSLLGMQPKLWEFIGKTGADEEAWRRVNLTVGARKHRFQVKPDCRKTSVSPK